MKRLKLLLPGILVLLLTACGVAAAVVPGSIHDITSSPRTRYIPLDNPEFLAPSATSYFTDDDLVLGLNFEGETRAYPVRMMRYHHVVNDTVGNRPILLTY